MAAYRDVVSGCYSQKQAYERTVVHSAPRFYITAKQAHDVLRKMVKGDFSEVDRFYPLKKKMYYDLYNILIEMSSHREYYKKSLWYICQFLVLQPAPEFYITPLAFSKIFMLYRKYGKYYKERMVYKPKNKNSHNDNLRSNASDGD